MKCGLLGEKLGHSYSPQIHSYLADYSYDLVEVAPEKLGEFLNSNSLSGFNVTIPYKKAVIPYCAQLSSQAAELGSVNTVIRLPDGTLYGDNTDYYGFYKMLERSQLNIKGKKVLVLGSGGASVTVRAVLSHAQANVVTISRSGADNYTNLHLHRDAAVIVNTTPVGMYPNTGISPIDLALFPQLEGVLDVVYNPARTQLLLDAENLGLKTENGLYMLVSQAKKAAELFTGTEIADWKIDSIYKNLSAQMENIVLVGMPGCGKTSIANALGALTGREVVDTDAEIVKLAGRPIPEIFAQDGEEVFRQLETQVLRAFGHRSGLILSTGGGCVTQERNYPILHQNGRLYWILRQLEALPIDGRPISIVQSRESLYARREPMYRRFADHIVQNDSTLEDAAKQIQRLQEGAAK